MGGCWFPNLCQGKGKPGRGHYKQPYPWANNSLSLNQWKNGGMLVLSRTVGTMPTMKPCSTRNPNQGGCIHAFHKDGLALEFIPDESRLHIALVAEQGSKLILTRLGESELAQVFSPIIWKDRLI